MSDELPRVIAMRAHVPPTKKHRRRPARGEPEWVLVFDTETTADASQALLFGSYRLHRADGRLVQEGLIHADDLWTEQLVCLTAYCAEHAADHGGRLRLRSRAQFVHWLIWKMGYEARARIVGFNLPFDFSRLATRWRPARNGGFTLRLFDSVDADGRVWTHKWRPELTIKALDSKRQLVAFTTPMRVDQENLDDGHAYRGRFLDLRTLSYALSDRSYTLDGAAAAWDLETRKLAFYRFGEVSSEAIDYNRQDTRLTHELYRALIADWRRHPISLDAEQAFSPAAVSKAYLRAMHITPPLERQRPYAAVLGAAATAYFGGRSETRIRLTPLPVRYVDFASMYPTVFALLGLWRHVVAERFVVEDATDQARTILQEVDREALHDPARWPELAMVFCRIRPGGDLLPTRARYAADAGAWTIGVNRLTSDTELWFTLADLLAGKLMGGPQPFVSEALRIAPHGTLEGLQSVALRGSLLVDPADDLLRLAIEERQRVRRRAGGASRERLASFLKTFANGGYGIFAESRVGEPVVSGVGVEAHGLWPIRTRVRNREEPGEFSFQPVAATITGTARLLLALAQAGIEARGGTYVACDTDSLLVVASPEGGLMACAGGSHQLEDGRAAVRGLSDPELVDVLDELNALNPYKAGTVKDLLKLEDENYCADHAGRLVELRALAISPKRYVLYELTADGPLIRKPSSHGLGMYRPPIENPEGWDRAWPHWVETVWQSIIREAEGLAPLAEPDWYDLPAVSQLSISSPALLRPFAAMNEGLAFREQIKPFNFMLIGHVDPLVPLPAGVELGQLTPIAPYTSKPNELLALPWVNRHDGRPLRVTTSSRLEAGAIRLKTYRDVIREYRLHPDAKSGDPAGGQSHRGSIGLLPRLHIRATEVRHIGKESNRLDEEAEGSLVDADDVYVEYRNERREWEQALPKLRELCRELGWRSMCQISGLSERALRYALNEGKMPHPPARTTLLALLSRA